ncbi:VWA domain-containing protein [Streptomyces sp. NPDC003035]|uniref:VWA domain-containing protein n=1 Tax=Streptomyces sp. NPDC003035 TaxID=3364676 RepID=UPI00368AEF8D
MTLPSPTPAESATERATTDTAAKRAADDLVAAAFDNLKVPNARPAEPEKPAEPKTEAAAAAETPEPAEPETEAAAAAETPEPAEPETEVAAAAEATEVSAAAGSTAEPAATELSETAVEQPDALEPTAEKVTEGEPATPEATVDTDARAPEGEADAPIAEDADASDDATAVEPAAADTAEPQADAPAAEEATTPAEQAEAETVDADVTVPEGEADTPAAEEAERGDADASDNATAAKPAAADTAEPETDTATDADAPEPVAAAVDAGGTPASEAEDAPATEPHGAPATTATPLSQVKADAPYLVEAYKAAGAVLKKQGLIGARAAVYLVVDRSGSMRGYFKDGSVQRLAEQTVALAAHLDEDATVTAVFFSTDIDGTAELRPAGLEGRIDEINAGLGRLGRTNYHRAVEEVLAHHEKTDPTRPAFVVFQTDGAPESKTAATQALAEAADRPIHWQFVAWGEEDNKAFDYLRKLTAPRTGHFLAGATPSETAHAAFYRGLLADWQL